MNNVIEIYFAAPSYGVLRTKGHAYSYMINQNQDKYLNIGDVICLINNENKISIATVSAKRYEADPQTKYKPLVLTNAYNLNIYPR